MKARLLIPALVSLAFPVSAAEAQPADGDGFPWEVPSEWSAEGRIGGRTVRIAAMEVLRRGLYLTGRAQDAGHRPAWAADKLADLEAQLPKIRASMQRGIERKRPRWGGPPQLPEDAFEAPDWPRKAAAEPPAVPDAPGWLRDEGARVGRALTEHLLGAARRAHRRTDVEEATALFERVLLRDRSEAGQEAFQFLVRRHFYRDGPGFEIRGAIRFQTWLRKRDLSAEWRKDLDATVSQLIEHVRSPGRTLYRCRQSPALADHRWTAILRTHHPEAEAAADEAETGVEDF